jgi:hypothetical protein
MNLSDICSHFYFGKCQGQGKAVRTTDLFGEIHTLTYQPPSLAAHYANDAPHHFCCSNFAPSSCSDREYRPRYRIQCCPQRQYHYWLLVFRSKACSDWPSTLCFSYTFILEFLIIFLGLRQPCRLHFQVSDDSGYWLLLVSFKNSYEYFRILILFQFR